MSLSPERLMAHAQVLRARGSALPPGATPAPEILDSWVRCVDAGLDDRSAMRVPVVEAGELARRRERAEYVRRLARAELETLTQQIAGSNFLLAFADPDGVILDLYADNRFTMSNADATIQPGSCWSESACGTNGLGTALVAGTSVAVSGLEHYFLQLGGISCTATPIRDAHGDIVGALDASSYFESRQRHTQALVQMAARHMENALLVHQMRSHLVIAVHPRPEFLGTLSAGLLAFDDDGRLLAANARARQILSGIAATPGVSFDDLFAEPLTLVMARLHRHDEVMLRDVLGSLLVARCASRPARKSESSTAASRAAAVGARAASADVAPARRAAGGGAPDDSLAAIGSGAPAADVGAPPSAPAHVFSVRHAPGITARFVADDPGVVQACRCIEQAVRMNVPILVCGETGTGKELLARHAHEASGRRGAFVAVNCAALPGELFEAELFGYVRGAFTGARREGSAGLIASADGGTLLLDEVGELPLPLQAALLRFLDDRSVRAVGGSTARPVDVQLLAATNADLDEAVSAQRFRADLLYRLNTVRVDLPPLRGRRDFAAAALSVLASLDARAAIESEAVERLARHGWPGNFRELRSVLARALLAAGGRPLRADDFDALPPAVGAAPASALQRSASEMIQREFERSGSSVSRTARGLGISRTTVYRHLRAAPASRRR
jgi:transcriptional regulator of acetoin/glycerol metabolism